MNKPKPKPAEYTPDFLAVWKSLPSRGGASDSKALAFKAYRARLREGVPHTEILAGAKAYAEHCDQNNSSGTQFVMQGATFLGPGRHWEQFSHQPRLVA